MMKNLNRSEENAGVLRALPAFALPYLLSCLMQTLYGMADLFIIGRYCGVDATTAVSIGSQVMHMVTVVLVGLAMGTTVLVGKSVGARDGESANAAVGNTVVLFAGISLLLTAGLLFAVRPVLALMSTPVEALEGAAGYLSVCFLGIPFITAYNVIGSIFRGMGNSKTPMLFVAVACVANILLDLLFIGVWGMGPLGAALGTALSQGISVLIALLYMAKRDMGIHLSRRHLRPQRAVLRELMGVGFPIALQDGFIQISFLAVTVFANRRGLQDAAAVGVVEKIIGILFLVPSAMLSTVSALSSQYIGANNPRAARATLRYAILAVVGFGILSASTMLIFAEDVVGLFTDDAVATVMGGQYMRGYVWDCVFAGIHFCFSGYFCAVGRSELSFVHNSASILLVRLPLAYYAATYVKTTLFPMGLATTCGSLLSVLICLIAYRWIRKRESACI